MHGLGNVVGVGEAQNAQLKKKIHLHDLELDFLDEGQFEEKGEESRRRKKSDLAVLNALEPPSHLKKLSIKWVMSTAVHTNWMTSLTNLRSLDINWCIQLECLPPLGKLPLLKELNIRRVENVKKLGDEFLGIDSENKSKKDDCHIINIFPNLRVLEIIYLPSWEEWIGMGGKREEEYKASFIEAWGNLKSPFCNIIFTLTLEPKGSIPPQHHSAVYSLGIAEVQEGLQWFVRSTWNKIREKHLVVDWRALVWLLFWLLFASNAFISWLTIMDKLPTPDMAGK
ncbi:putative disease resistance rpp13-like protein 1 [Quercus suber]|uniref:Disease resistance rpp13-like protein 1 n=1 Tax=Quercus suber TaxID=58331 RepID=A0AAW0K8J4_QUESU